MSDCTVADVLNGAMSLLGDPDGEITQEIVDDLGTAYSNMMALAIKLRLPAIKRETYFTLPANTATLFPSTLGVNDFAEPTRLWERGNVTQVAVTGTTDGTPITVNTSAPHGVSTSQRVELNGIQGVPDWVNRDWYVTVTGTTAFTLNGSITAGADGTGGNVMYSPDRFLEMSLTDTLPSQVPGQRLGFYMWEEGALWFPGSVEKRQLWIEYTATETTPAAGIIGFANGRELNFLKHATAAHFAPKRQLPMGPQLMATAYGPTGEPDGSAGLLRALMVPMLNERQGRPQTPRLYRRRRTSFPIYR